MKDNQEIVSEGKEEFKNPFSNNANPANLEPQLSNDINNHSSSDIGRQQLIGPTESRDMGTIGAYDEGISLLFL